MHIPTPNEFAKDHGHNPFPPRWERWLSAVRAGILSAQPVAGRNVSISEHPGKGTVINAERRRVEAEAPPECGCPDPPFTVEIHYEASVSINECDPFDRIIERNLCTSPNVVWLRNGTEDWQAFWDGINSTLPAGVAEGPPDDEGTWCDMFNPYAESSIEACACGEFASWNPHILVIPRYGTINGDTGWHVLVFAYASTTDCTEIDYVDWGWFNTFLGATFEGTIGPMSWGPGDEFTATVTITLL